MARATILDRRVTGELLGGDDCMFLRHEGQEIRDCSLRFETGSLRPGERIKAMGGRKTSAGFRRIEMLPGRALEFMGVIEGLEGRLAVFQTAPQRLPEGFLAAYWIAESECALLYFTPACAGRVIELEEFEEFDNGTSDHSPRANSPR